MRRAIYDRFGSAEDVLRIETDAPIPEPADDEIRIRVHAASVNPVDCAVRRGYGREYFGKRGISGLPNVPGRDVSGVVDAVGATVDKFRPGDDAFAITNGRASAEYVTVKAGLVAPKPANISYVEAASIPFIAMTTWTALVVHAGLSPDNAAGQRILIPRGSGGVGSFAIQLVKSWGGYVVSTCSERNIERVRSFGADEVIDYTTADLATAFHEFDVVLDTLGHEDETTHLNALKTHANARYVSLVSPLMLLTDEHGIEDGQRHYDEMLAARQDEQAKHGRQFAWSFMQPNGQVLIEIGLLVEAGTIRPVVDRTYPLEEIADAHAYVESRHARGKVVLTVRDDT